MSELLEIFWLNRDPEQEDDASVKVEMASFPPIDLVGYFRAGCDNLSIRLRPT